MADRPGETHEQDLGDSRFAAVVGTALATQPLRLAYADPPYPGQAKRWYADHPDFAGEVDHAELVQGLAAYDGWALSTSAAALQAVLALCPAGVRVGVWYRQNSEPPGNRGTWWWTWEPVIFSPARAPLIPTRDMLSHHKEQGFLGSTIPGQKPRAVCEWIFALLGALPDDDLADLFPGSGAVKWAWDGWRAQGNLLRCDVTVGRPGDKTPLLGSGGGPASATPGLPTTTEPARRTPTTGNRSSPESGSVPGRAALSGSTDG